MISGLNTVSMVATLIRLIGVPSFANATGRPFRLLSM